jgi:hypothetical protein
MEIINNLKMIKMNKFITTILSLSIITFVISCTDLDEDLRGVITSDISVEGIATDDGKMIKKSIKTHKKQKRNKKTKTKKMKKKQV